MMWYTGDSGSSPARIGLATSTDGVNWQKSAGNPVLSPNQNWETEGIVVGSVIHDGTFFRMWYAGYDSSWVARIGYASSPDGITWTKLGSNPILDVGASGSWDDGDVRGPAVIREGVAYHMWYEGNDGMTSRIGHATSSDGVSWTKDPANPVLDVGQTGHWDWLDVYSPHVIVVGGQYVLWYSGETLPLAWQMGYALSSDGSQWTRGEMVVPEGSSGAFDDNSADDASVLLDGTVFKIWYSGHDGSRYTIGYATADLCSAPGAVQPPHTVYLPVAFRNWGTQCACPADYRDRFDDPASGWPVSDSSSRRYAYVDGQYQIWVKRPSQSWMVTPGAKATDFAVAVSARRVSGSGGAYGVIFGVNSDWSELYEVILDANRYSVWKYDGGWSPLRSWTSSGHINGGTGWNRLKVIRSQDDIAIYVNDQHPTTIVDGSFTGLRRIGLVAYAFGSGPIDARFDDFALYPVSCGPSAAGIAFEMGVPEVHWGPVPPGPDTGTPGRGE